ncbi:hypothetical protein [Brachyspira sp.]|uniref:hypothetical protein n=1 Tax=Brachyspira sp. TaxID=1977261 RepID=UPI003D7ECF11
MKKRNETKGLLLSLINNHFKTFLITLLSLTLLFSISCSNEGTTGGGGNDGADSVPTFTGYPATDLVDGYYQGTLYYKSHSISEDFQYSGTTKEEFFGADGIDITSDKTFYLKIANNKLKWGENELEIESDTTIEKEALKSGSEYGATIEDGQINEQGSYKERKTIKFTISEDGNTISITYFEGQSADMNVEVDDDGNTTYAKLSYDATYEGTLKKYTPTPTPTPSGS